MGHEQARLGRLLVASRGELQVSRAEQSEGGVGGVWGLVGGVLVVGHSSQFLEQLLVQQGVGSHQTLQGYLV